MENRVRINQIANEIKAIENKILDAVRSGTQKMFNTVMPNLSIHTQANRWAGLQSFQIYIKDEDDKVVFASEVEVKLHSYDKTFSRIDTDRRGIMVTEPDFSIKTVRICSNERSLDNEYHKAQVLISAFVMMNKDDEFKALLDKVGKEILALEEEADAIFNNK